ncbi:MAG: hypothetical protein PW786_03435 [Arachidicoccus sp.]|nr:hypothetical protein [Arachidicoccus sp.]
MKKFLFILFFFAFNNYLCSAQNRPLSNNNKIEKLKKDYLTQKLELTPSESKAFWPLYKSYFGEISKVWQENDNKPTREFKERAAEIRDTYRPEFFKVLGSHARANSVYIYEKEYRDMLRKTLQERGKN